MFKLSVLHLLDGIGQIQGALASTTTHELSNTPFTSNTPHGEGIQQIANFCEAEYETTLERYVICMHCVLHTIAPASSGQNDTLSENIFVFYAH